MAVSQQVLHKVYFEKLKGIKELELDFGSNALTAILGPNGSGKSTIIHALACINNPIGNRVNYRFSQFFTPTTHSIWNGSRFIVTQSYRDGVAVFPNQNVPFRKEASRWAPRYIRRIPRYTSFIGIKSCVPIIESEKQQSRIQFNTTALNDVNSNKVRTLAGQVMNREYTEFNTHVTPSNKRYIGVTDRGVSYSSLSMGAGEQRIFNILSEVVNAPNHGLILIDEIDLLLHEDALIRLLHIINKIALQKLLQVIFTTHAHAILPLSFINFRHLYQTPAKTLCFHESKPDTLHRLTGAHIRPLEVFVEDDLAHFLIKKICSDEGISRFVSIREFGAAINCFTSIGGAILNSLANIDNMLFVLDGDEYSTEPEKIEKVARVLTGDTQGAINKRAQALSKITQFNLPDGSRPEHYYHSLICALDENTLSEEQQEIMMIAREMVNPDNTHKFLDNIITRLDLDRTVGLSKLVDMIALSEAWPNIKQSIKNWIDAKKDALVEAPALPV